MYNYAQLNEQGIVVGVSSANKEIIAESIIPTEIYNPDLIGKKYEGGNFTDAPVISSEQNNKSWRDSELAATDWIVPTVDHPQHAAYIIYRQALRDWPDDPKFPDGNRPTL